LTTKWVGSCLKRLGFKEKHRVGTGYEYKLSKDVVQDLAVRMGIEKRGPCLKEELEKIRKWIVENKDASGLIDINALIVHIKELGESNPDRIIEALKHDDCLFPVPNLGKLGVG
jgi:hypothetical protein